MQDLGRRVNLRDSPTVKCDKCDSVYFREVIYLKFVSRLQGAPEDTTVPFPIYKCDECGHINKGQNPFEEQQNPIISEE